MRRKLRIGWIDTVSGEPAHSFANISQRQAFTRRKVAVRYSDRHMRTKVRLLLPSRVIGTHMQGKMHNGDFSLCYQDVLRGDLSRIERVQPAPFNE